MPMGMKIAIVGRGHSGKNRLAELLAAHFDLNVLKTSTDRPRRWPGEDTYEFYTKEQADAIPMDDKLFYTERVDGFARWADKAKFLASDIAILDPPGAVQAVRLWQAAGHAAKAIYIIADEDQRRASWIRDIVQNGGDEEDAGRKYEARNAVEAPMFDAVEDMIRTDAEQAEADAILYPNFTHAPLVLFGADQTDVWRNTFDPDAMDAFCGRVGRELLQWGNRRGGCRKFWSREPIILEPEDWTRDEWRAIMKLLGLEPDDTTRAVVHVSELECYIDPDAENGYKS